MHSHSLGDMMRRLLTERECSVILLPVSVRVLVVVVVVSGYLEAPK